MRCGGHVAIEWPRACSYWRENAVTSFVSKHGFSRVTFDGCALGLVSNRTGLPIKKPWAVLTSCPQLVSALQVFVCPGPVVHSTHQPCAGSETKATEGYTPKLASIVHDVFRALLPRHRALVALPALLRPYQAIPFRLVGTMAGASSAPVVAQEVDERVATSLVDQPSLTAQAGLRPAGLAGDLREVHRWWIKSQPDGVPYFYRTDGDGDVAAWKLPEGEVPLVPKSTDPAPPPPPRTPDFGWYGVMTPFFLGHAPAPDVPEKEDQLALVAVPSSGSAGNQPGGGGPAGDQPGAGTIDVDLEEDFTEDEGPRAAPRQHVGA